MHRTALQHGDMTNFVISLAGALLEGKIDPRAHTSARTTCGYADAAGASGLPMRMARCMKERCRRQGASSVCQHSPTCGGGRRERAIDDGAADGGDRHGVLARSKQSRSHPRRCVRKHSTNASHNVQACGTAWDIHRMAHDIVSLMHHAAAQRPNARLHRKTRLLRSVCALLWQCNTRMA